MSDRDGPRAVVAGHGDLASALVGAVDRIVGKAGALRAVTNDGRDAARTEQAIRDALRDLDASVVFTDLPAGSCTMAARRIAHDDPSVSVVTGVSVPMLLDFVFGAAATSADLERSARAAREAIRVFGPPGAADAG